MNGWSHEPYRGVYVLSEAQRAKAKAEAEAERAADEEAARVPDWLGQVFLCAMFAFNVAVWAGVLAITWGGWRPWQ